MSEPFLGEIRLVGFNFPPRGFANCDGQLLPISSNPALFSLLGTMYGGDGRTTFALPDLRGRVALHTGTGAGLTPRSQGSRSGAETQTPSTGQMPAHSHTQPNTADHFGTVRATASGAGTSSPGGNTLAMAPAYSGDAPSVDMAANSVAIPGAPHLATNATGNNQAQNNMQPYLTLRYVIALSGLFPSRN